jgi:MFS family permease
MLIIRFPEKLSIESVSTDRQRGSIMDGLRFIFRDRTMRLILIAVVLTNCAVEALRTLAPSLAAEQGVPEAAGLIVMGYSLGGLIGLVLFGQAERRIPPRILLPVAFALQAVGLAFVAFAPTVVLMLVAAVPIGVGFSLAIPRLSAGLQMRASDSYRSRVMAAFTMAHLGLRPFFALLAGALAMLSIDAAIVVFVLLALAAAIFVARRNIVGPSVAPLD